MESLISGHALTDETSNAIGAEIAEMLNLKHSREHKDRWQTSVGTKTNQGLARTIFGVFAQKAGCVPSVPAKVRIAIEHVRQRFPSVSMVVYNPAGQWRFMSEDFNAPKFTGELVNVDILEAAANEVDNSIGFPAVFFLPEK